MKSMGRWLSTGHTMHPLVPIVLGSQWPPPAEAAAQAPRSLPAAIGCGMPGPPAPTSTHQPTSTHLRHILHHAVVLLLLQPCLELIQAPLQLRGLALRLAGLGEGDAAAPAQLQAGTARGSACRSAAGRGAKRDWRQSIQAAGHTPTCCIDGTASSPRCCLACCTTLLTVAQSTLPVPVAPEAAAAPSCAATLSSCTQQQAAWGHQCQPHGPGDRHGRQSALDPRTCGRLASLAASRSSCRRAGVSLSCMWPRDHSPQGCSDQKGGPRGLRQRFR